MKDTNTKNINEFLSNLADKLQSGGRLNFEDGLALYSCDDIFGLGKLAEQITLNRYGPEVYYSINRHINYSNICEIGCSFCRFSRRPGDTDGYIMSVDEVVDQAREAAQQDATEVHIVGSVNPQLSFDYFVDLISGIHTQCPDLHIKAFTAVEIITMAQKANLTVEQVLCRLQQNGLGSLPGGGAEILSDDYFAQVCPDKPRPGQWLSVHKTAHRLELMTNATMLYGFSETPADRIRHLLTLRDLQDESLKLHKGCFQCFVPLPYTTGITQTEQKDNDDSKKGPHVLSDLKTIAISRLILDNVDNIKAFWPMLGLNLAQIALCFGANDLDGTVGHYHIVEHDTGDRCEGLSPEQIKSLISETGRKPVQRDSFYRPI